MTNKKKGFTLIELLVAILIVALVGTVGFISIRAVIDNSKKKSNSLNLNNIYDAAYNYTLEYKKIDDFWFEDDESQFEYSCSTIQNIINKGFLKENVFGTYNINNDLVEINGDTSIKIVRNKSTKTIEKSYVIDDISCNELDELELEIKLPLPDGLDNWYKSNFNIEINLLKSFSTGISKYVYSVIDNGKYIYLEDLNNPLNNVTYNFSYNSKNVSFCVNAFSNKEKSKMICTDYIKVDTHSPIINDININDEDIYTISKEIEINNFTEETSGINKFEYYLTSDINEIGDISSLKLNDKILFDTDIDGSYLLVRGIDNAGNIGDWSLPKKILVDTKPPIINKNNDLYEVTNNSNIEIIDNYFTVNQNGKGKIVDSYCYLDNNNKVSNTSNLAIGSYKVTCEVIKENKLKSNDSIELIVKQGYKCDEGILLTKDDAYVCVVSASEKGWYITTSECLEYGQCCDYEDKRVNDCNICGILNDDGSPECDACTDKCTGPNKLQCLVACKSPCQDKCRTCTVREKVCKKCCIDSKKVKTYYCETNWKVFAGSDESLKCYKNASRG